MMRLENFSAGYMLAPDIRVEPYSGDSAVMQDSMYDWLVERLGEPLRGIVGGVNFQFQPERSVPDLTAGIPQDVLNADGFDTVLLEKPAATAGVIL